MKRILPGFFLLELDSAYRGSFTTMLLLQRIEMVATVVALSLLCFSSWLSMRESPSRLARGQAQVFVTGLALLFVATAGAGMLSGGSLTAVTFGAALSPVPLGYAIARYHLFDFGTTIRRTVAHFLYLSIWSGLFFLGVVLLRDQLPIPEWLRHPVAMFAGVYGVLAPLDFLRHLLKRSIEGVADGDRVRVRSRRGSIEISVRMTRRVPEGTVFIPMHYHEAAANEMTIDALDPVVKIPELKVCAVAIERVETVSAGST